MELKTDDDEGVEGEREEREAVVVQKWVESNRGCGYDGWGRGDLDREGAGRRKEVEGVMVYKWAEGSGGARKGRAG